MPQFEQVEPDISVIKSAIYRKNNLALQNEYHIRGNQLPLIKIYEFSTPTRHQPSVRGTHSHPFFHI